MRLSISEIVNQAIAFKKKEDRIEFLRKHDSVPLRQVLRIMYDPAIEILLPDSIPPWTKNDYVGVEGMLYKEARRLRIFVKGGGYDNLAQVKREDLFISLLKDIDNADAELVSKIVLRKPLKGLTVEVLLEAFPTLYQTKIA